MKVEKVEIGLLQHDEANPRTHGERNLAEVAASLRDHGQVEPLVVQASTMRVVAGNARLEAMRSLGWTHVDVVLVDVSDVEARALSVRLNRAGEFAGWDPVALASAVKEIAAAGESWSLGFSADEIEAIVGDAVRASNEEASRFVAGGSETPPETFPDAEPEPDCTCPRCGFSWERGKG